MIEIQDTKFVSVFFSEALVDDDDPVGAYGDANPVSIDTRGYQYAVVTVKIGTTDVALTALGVFGGTAAASGADDAGFTAITQLTGSDLPSATDDGEAVRFFIDLRNNPYSHLAVDCTVGNGTNGGFVSAWCDLYKADESPLTDTARGLLKSTIV